MFARELSRRCQQNVARAGVMKTWARLRTTMSAVPGGGGGGDIPGFALASYSAGPPMSNAGAGSLGVADIAAVPRMKSSELRRLSEAAAAACSPDGLGADPRLWDAISARCQASAEQLNYWDSVLILQAYASARVDHKETMLRLGEALSSKTTQLAPKHIMDLLAVYEAFELRPRALYVELFHGLIRLSKSMYAEEVALALQALARYRIGNPTVVSHLVRTVMRQLGEFRLRYLCGVAGALGSLDAYHPWIFAELDKRAKFEVDTIPLQELYDNVQAFPKLEFSWRPYEDLCLQELLARTKTLVTAKDMDQFVDPFQAMGFLQSRNLLSAEFLEALCQWCLYGVHRPNVRSEKRPTAQQLVMLHDRCAEYGLENMDALQDAIQYYVESGGGRWPRAEPAPLMYRKKRHYIRAPDPVEDLLVGAASPPTLVPTARLHRGTPNLLGLPGLPEADAQDLLVGAVPPSTVVPTARQHRAAPNLPGLPGLPEADAQDLVGLAPTHLDHVSESAPQLRGPMEPRRNIKPSAGETVECWVTSRKSPRPRVIVDRALKRIFRQRVGRAPLWYQGGWEMRPKYQQGVKTRRYPYAGVPVGPRGAAWVMRR